MRTKDGLSELLRPERLTAIVDIGANPIDGDPPYKAMLQRRLCHLTGFDPHPQALIRLNAIKSDLETYLPYAIGDGGHHTLKICRGLGFASLLKPDTRTLSHFPMFSELGSVLREMPVSSRRLDDIAEVSAIDMLKIDVQGSELSVIQNGCGLLSKAVVVQTEVSFIPIYENQPVFGDIDLEMRRLGFVPHMFAAINRKMIAPMQGSDPASAFHQLVEADVVYVRNFIDADAMNPEQLKHLAIIAHHCYGSYDLAMNCIHHLVRRGMAAADATTQYLGLVQQVNAPPDAGPSFPID